MAFKLAYTKIRYISLNSTIQKDGDRCSTENHQDPAGFLQTELRPRNHEPQWGHRGLFGIGRFHFGILRGGLGCDPQIHTAPFETELVFVGPLGIPETVNLNGRVQRLQTKDASKVGVIRPRSCCYFLRVLLNSLS